MKIELTEGQIHVIALYKEAKENLKEIENNEWFGKKYKKYKEEAEEKYNKYQRLVANLMLNLADGE